MRIVSLLFLIFFTGNLVGETTLSDIEKQLMCMCGCGMLLSTCQCSTAEEFRQEIQSKLVKGVPADQIIEGFVARYGETVLASPTKSGFNLTAWITPIVALLSGITALFLIIRAFSQRYSETYVENTPTRPGEFSRKVDEQLKEFL